MKKFLILFICIIFPGVTFADIAGPVLTKNQACQEKDGSSTNRLQIFWNGAKSDTLYFYKYKNRLFYTISVFPYTFTEKDIYGAIHKEKYFAAVFLYQYDCGTRSVARLSDNLKPLSKKIWGPVNGEEIISQRIRRELGYGQISEVTDTKVTVNLFIPQTGVYTNPISIFY